MNLDLLLCSYPRGNDFPLGSCPVLPPSGFCFLSKNEMFCRSKHGRHDINNLRWLGGLAAVMNAKKDGRRFTSSTRCCPPLLTEQVGDMEHAASFPIALYFLNSEFKPFPSHLQGPRPFGAEREGLSISGSGTETPTDLSRTFQSVPTSHSILILLEALGSSVR